MTRTARTAVMTLALLFVGLAVSSETWAGFQETVLVTIDMTNRGAGGSLADARSSADSVQYIGCIVAATNPGGTTMYCSAKDSTGTYVNCTSSDPDLVDAARSVKGDSDIAFYWDSNANCTLLWVQNYSVNSPKQP